MEAIPCCLPVLGGYRGKLVLSYNSQFLLESLYLGMLINAAGLKGHALLANDQSLCVIQKQIVKCLRLCCQYLVVVMHRSDDATVYVMESERAVPGSVCYLLIFHLNWKKCVYSRVLLYKGCNTTTTETMGNRPSICCKIWHSSL